jgi:hypothetical protein
MEHAQETGNLAMVKRAKAIISKITVDEVTNSVLRHSPTVDDPTATFKKEDRIKIIVIRDRDSSSIMTSVVDDMHQLEVISMDNIDFGAKLLTQMPDRFDKTTIPQTLADNCPEHIVRHYCGTSSNKFAHAISPKVASKTILKADLKSVLDSEVLRFPKNNAISLVDPKIKTIVEYNPGLKRGERVGESALLTFISSQLPRKKDLNTLAPKVSKPKTTVDFDPLVVDAGDRAGMQKKIVRGESMIRKNILNMVRGEMLKEEIEKGKRFYRLFSKVVFGDPKNSSGDAV